MFDGGNSDPVLEGTSGKLREKCEDLERRYRSEKIELRQAKAKLEEETERHRQAEHELAKKEMSLRMSEADLARAQQMAHVGGWCWDLKGNTITGSDEFYRILGYPPGKISITVDQFKNTVHPDDIPFIDNIHNAALRNKKPYSADFRVVRPDGGIRNIHVVTEFAYGDRGDVERIYGTVQDITERIQAETSLQEAKTRAELYVDLMGHDIVNINQAIMGYLEMARDTIRLKNNEREFIEKPLELLKSSTTLIGNVKKLQRAMSGEPALKPVDIVPIITGLAAQYSQASGKAIELAYDTKAVYNVMANEMIKDLFGNIIENAVRHSRAPDGVRIMIRPGRKYYRVEVEDNGPGVPDELKAGIFAELMGKERYVRRKGLGLQIVKALVKAYGGRVWVEDRVPGDHTRGARFVVMLPALNKTNIVNAGEK